jgi:hypothetical protein
MKLSIGSANQYDRMVVINTGAGDDEVNISQRQDGSLDAEINGQKFHIVLGPDRELAIRSGDGRDRIVAFDSVTVGMDVRGGAGDDTITTGQGIDRVDSGLGNDSIVTNAGRDDVFGNSGNDVIDTGDGHDQARGGDGDDVLRGGRGRDYLDGGQHRDVIEGGSANDVLVGGQGDDTLRSQEGDDRVYTGSGQDRVDNAAGHDVVYGQTSEDTITAAKDAGKSVTDVDMTERVGSSVKVVGSDEFRQRVESDLEFLRSSPEGRKLLEQLDVAASENPDRVVTINEMANERNGRSWPYDEAAGGYNNNGYFQHSYPDDGSGEPVMPEQIAGICRTGH